MPGGTRSGLFSREKAPSRAGRAGKSLPVRGKPPGGDGFRPESAIFAGQKRIVMELSELQRRVDEWIRGYGVRYFGELTNLAILTEEVGELARVMARKYGEQSFKEGERDNLADEMADVLWVLVCLANQTGVDLTAAVEANFAKKSARDSERHKRNPKLNGNPGQGPAR